jgi:hypothetical protein
VPIGRMCCGGERWFVSNSGSIALRCIAHSFLRGVSRRRRPPPKLPPGSSVSGMAANTLAWIWIWIAVRLRWNSLRRALGQLSGCATGRPLGRLQLYPRVRRPRSLLRDGRVGSGRVGWKVDGVGAEAERGDPLRRKRR